MSLSYAESLSAFPHKGKVGMPELSEKPDDLKNKLEQLVEMIRQSHHTVVITGAGISTEAGIPDFRGPNGVWTLEKRGEKPSFNTSFEEAQPTYTHQALRRLEENNYIHFVISQNIDGLHHRSGLALDKLAELHGNVFSEECEACGTQVIRPTCVGSFCRKRTGNVCNSEKGRNKNLRCRGKLRDTVLDWEDPLPEPALKSSEQHCAKADLCLCLGTSLQIRPCRDLPRKTKKNGGQIVIVNLQKTSMDSLASLIIHERCDQVMKYVLNQLRLDVDDPPRMIDSTNFPHVQKVFLLVGRSSAEKEEIETKLTTKLNGVLLHLTEVMKLDYLKHKNASIEIDSSNLIRWEEEIIRDDPTRFCRLLISSNCSTNSIWIIGDVQRSAEVNYFQNQFNDRLQLVRVEKQNEMEKNCEEFSWNFVFSFNEGNSLEEEIEKFVSQIQC